MRASRGLKWENKMYKLKRSIKHKTQYHVDFPPFNEFSQFIQEIARERNDP